LSNEWTGLKGLHHKSWVFGRVSRRKSGGLELGQTLVAEVIADLGAEEASLRFCTEECLVISSREFEVAIDVAGVAEPQIEYLPGIVISDRREHLRIQRFPLHIAAPSSRD